MNRKERRAALKRGRNDAAAPRPAGDRSGSLDIADLMATARAQVRQGGLRQAHDICHQILALEPLHVDALNLTGLMAQASGRHNAALKLFSRAIAADELNAACHFNMASSYQALGRRDDAAVHFTKAIALGLTDQDVEGFVTQSPVIAACLQRIAANWPLPAGRAELFGSDGLAGIAGDTFFRCAMESTLIRGVPLQVFMTGLRSALLDVAKECLSDGRDANPDVEGLFCALAQQCFINEYVFEQSGQEIADARRLLNLLEEKLASGADIAPLLLIAVAAYFPLFSLSSAQSVLDRTWPKALDGLLRQQIREPLAEAQYRTSIRALTAIEDRVSLEVMQQYEENPYPRWTHNPLAMAVSARRDNPENGAQRAGSEILIAGCGTGRHALQTAQLRPDANVLAVDVSLASLAYAARKTREAGLRNIEYAQADILKLGSIGRRFDRIESIGVLHHLADPKAGWLSLLSLLRPDGEMYVGLYSEAARRAMIEARALIAARGYRAVADDIRRCRQEIIRQGDDSRWKPLIAATDFYSMSGCRDLMFNVMEHRFTIPEIKTFLGEHDLVFLGFDLDPAVIEKFRQRFAHAAALVDLDCWAAFEDSNPQTFEGMYIFSLRRAAVGPR